MLQIHCSECNWTVTIQSDAALRLLQSAGMLRRNASAEPDERIELLRATAQRLDCPGCGRGGLTLRENPEDDADWPQVRACADCGAAIDRERLEALPAAVLCTTCQQKEDRGQVSGPVEYCPRCGSPLVVRRGGGAGITRYELVCSGWPRCRGRG